MLFASALYYMLCPQLIGIPNGHLKSCTNGGLMQFVQNSGKFTLIAALGRGPWVAQTGTRDLARLHFLSPGNLCDMEVVVCIC